MSILRKKVTTILMKDAPGSDEELKEWLREGPGRFNYRKAIRFLIKTELPATTLYLKRYGCSEQDAEEVFLDALMIITHNIQTVEIQKNVAAYLKRICRNKYISRDRKIKLDMISTDTENSGEMKALDQKLEEMDLQIEGKLEDAQFVETLRNLMNRLSEGCRSVLTSKYFGGFTAGEIAGEEGINTQSVRNQISRCLKNLRTFINEDPYLDNLLRARL